MTAATLTAAEGLGETFLERSMSNIPRSLYLYENVGVQALAVHSATTGRSLYLYENVGLEAIVVEARSLYLYENLAIEALVVLARALYAYATARDGEPFPWLMRIDPEEQFRGGQVDLYGDGLGEIIERAADVGNVITASSTSGGDVPANVRDRLTAEWISTDGAAAWIRVTFPAPRTVVAVALEDRLDNAHSWGVPEFRFSDGGPNVNGAVSVPKPSTSAEIPVGLGRGYYAFPGPRTTDYLEIRVASGGGGANRGLRELWIYCDEDQAAEGSETISNLGGPAEATFGIVSWSSRSPGLWPANGGLPIEKAATVTVAATAESGLVKVRENI